VLDKLLRAGSASLSRAAVDRSALPSSDLSDELARLLMVRNGFFAFESALLFRPCGVSDLPILDSAAWNRLDTWKASYPETPEEVTFFAEDLFGGQFGIADDSIMQFFPETGELRTFASSFEEWATKIIEDYEVVTGYPLAHDWQAENGPLAPGHRLVPRVPFVLGGEFSVANLRSVPEVASMRFYGGLAHAIAGVPDGQVISLELKDLSSVLDGL